jgi:hypothetical protein
MESNKPNRHIVLRIGLALLLLGTGYLINEIRIARYKDESQRQASESYELFQRLGSGNWDDLNGLSALKPVWARQLKSRLEADLQRPWGPVGDDLDDCEWGTAFFVLRDSGGRFGWAYKPQMSSIEQDEMIRYLCYRLRRADVVLMWYRNDEEVTAMLTYPSPALERNGPVIEHLVRQVFKFNNASEVVSRTVGTMLTCMLDQRWAQDLAMEHFRQLASANASDFDMYRFYGEILSISKGYSELKYNPPPKVKSGAADLIKQIRAVKWSNELGIESRYGSRVENMLDPYGRYSPMPVP